jgi:RNA polymerase sigma-70 factor (ECF subfamily)
MRNDAPNPGGARDFATTRWSVVLAAGGGASPESEQALASLCEAYWYPLYAFVRRLGHQPDDAQDLTQAFFARVLEKGYLRAADPGRGRFRCFLLAALKHFLANERERARAHKRGGGRAVLPLDFQAGEQRYRLEPAHERTAGRLYERRWALTLLGQVLARLREEFARAGKAPLFDRLKAYLTGENASASYREVGAELGMSEGAVKVAVHRLRGRYRELLLGEIAQTVAAPEEVEEELLHLFEAISSK